MDFRHHNLHQQQLHDSLHINPHYVQVINPIVLQETSGDIRDRDRFPQWTNEETKEFLAIRFELDKSFTETKRNKPLWVAMSARLQEKGFFRTPEQCKSKWKNLVTRFKGSESAEIEANRVQFSFYEEMRRIFSQRTERLLYLEKGKGKGVQIQVKELEEEENEEEEEKLVGSEEKLAGIKKKRKVQQRKKSLVKEVEGALREFSQWQLEMETRLMEAAEVREAERRVKEKEWRRMMEALQQERIEKDRWWREQEEARREREEARAERRHDLVMALLNKLAEKDF